MSTVCQNPECAHLVDATDEKFCWCCTNLDPNNGLPYACNECGETNWVKGPGGGGVGQVFECQGCGDILYPGCPVPG